MTGVLPLLAQSVRLYRAHVSLLGGFAAWALLPAIVGLAAQLIPNENASALVILLAFLAEGTAIVWASVAIMRATRALNVHAPVPDTTFEQFGRLIVSLLTVVILQMAVLLGGLILFVIPGLVSLVWFAFAQQAVVLDGARPLEALSQSRSMSTGRFFRVGWRIIGGPLIMLTLYTIALSTVFALVGLPTEAFPLWAQAIDAAATILLIFPLSAVYTTLLYDEMKKKPA